MLHCPRCRKSTRYILDSWLLAYCLNCIREILKEDLRKYEKNHEDENAVKDQEGRTLDTRHIYE